MPGGHWRGDGRARAVLDEARLLHVAVTTPWGTHVTPTLFSVEDGRLWLVVARRSVKARALARSGRVGVLARAGRRAFVGLGRADIVDPLSARGLTPGKLFDLPLAATGYLSRNGRHAVGVARKNAVPTLPVSRLAIVIDVRRAALLEDGEVETVWGAWERRALLLAGPPAPPPGPPALAGVPARQARLLAGDSPVVLGWPSCSGPLAVPGRWDPVAGTTSASAELMTLAGAWTAGPGCLTVARTGTSLSAKHGLLVAGPGRARLDGAAVAVGIGAGRVTWWDGDKSGTLRSHTTGRTS